MKLFNNEYITCSIDEILKDAHADYPLALIEAIFKSTFFDDAKLTTKSAIKFSNRLIKKINANDITNPAERQYCKIVASYILGRAYQTNFPLTDNAVTLFKHAAKINFHVRYQEVESNKNYNIRKLAAQSAFILFKHYQQQIHNTSHKLVSKRAARWLLYAMKLGSKQAMQAFLTNQLIHKIQQVESKTAEQLHSYNVAVLLMFLKEADTHILRKFSKVYFDLFKTEPFRLSTQIQEIMEINHTKNLETELSNIFKENLSNFQNKIVQLVIHCQSKKVIQSPFWNEAILQLSQKNIAPPIKDKINFHLFNQYLINENDSSAFVSLYEVSNNFAKFDSIDILEKNIKNRPEFMFALFDKSYESLKPAFNQFKHKKLMPASKEDYKISYQIPKKSKQQSYFIDNFIFNRLIPEQQQLVIKFNYAYQCLLRSDSNHMQTARQKVDDFLRDLTSLSEYLPLIPYDELIHAKQAIDKKIKIVPENHNTETSLLLISTVDLLTKGYEEERAFRQKNSRYVAWSHFLDQILFMQTTKLMKELDQLKKNFPRTDKVAYPVAALDTMILALDKLVEKFPEKKSPYFYSLIQHQYTKLTTYKIKLNQNIVASAPPLTPTTLRRQTAVAG